MVPSCAIVDALPRSAGRNECWGTFMLKRTLAIAFSAAFATAISIAPMGPAYAEMAAPKPESTKGKKDTA